MKLGLAQIGALWSCDPNIPLSTPGRSFGNPSLPPPPPEQDLIARAKIVKLWTSARHAFVKMFSRQVK